MDIEKYIADKFENISKMTRNKIKNFASRIFSDRIGKDILKGNILLNISLIIRHIIVENKKAVTMTAGAFAVSIFLIAFYVSSHEKKVMEANKWFEVGLSFYKRAFFDEKLSPEERSQSISESIRRFQYVVEQYSGTSLKDDSILYQGNAYFELQDFNNALKKYQELADSNKNYYYIDQVWINIGKCYEQLNNTEGAIVSYQVVIDKYKTGAAQAEFQIAKINELSGKGQEAFQGYQDIIKDYPQSMWAQESRKRILFLQAMSQSQAEKPQAPAQDSLEQLLR